MRGTSPLTVPQIIHPKPVTAPVTFLVYFASSLALATPLSPLLKIPPTPQYQDTPLHFAASNGHEAASRVLIEAGAKVDALDDVSWHCM